MEFTAKSIDPPACLYAKKSWPTNRGLRNEQNLFVRETRRGRIHKIRMTFLRDVVTSIHSPSEQICIAQNLIIVKMRIR